VELLALVLPRWGAVAIVLGLFLLDAVILVAIVRKRLSAIEAPDATVRRRMEESRRWCRKVARSPSRRAAGAGRGE
jgi:hypothetical protein